MNFIKMHPTNDPKDTSIQTEDHNKNKFADNKNKFADHNIYSDIPNFPDSSQGEYLQNLIVCFNSGQRNMKWIINKFQWPYNNSE